MKEKLRVFMSLVLAGVFIISFGLLLRQLRDNASGEKAYQEAASIAAEIQPSEETEPTTAETSSPTETVKQELVWLPAPVEEDPVMEEMADIDLAALREVNADVIGWIRIPDTEVDYPLMQGQDNDYYLDHTWDKRGNSVGSIFAEHRNSPDLTDFNTILYGHNMRSGAMFASLHKYKQQEYWQAHPFVYLASDAGVYRYEVFAAYEAAVDSPTYGLSFNQTKTRVNYLQHALDSSEIQTQLQPETTDRFLTLSTCSGAGYATRWVVQARLKMVETVR